MKRKSIRAISEGTLVRVVYDDNMHGHAVADIDVFDVAMNGVTSLVGIGEVVGRNDKFLVIASQYPEDKGGSENGYNIIGVLWKCIVKLEVLKPCSQSARR